MFNQPFHVLLHEGLTIELNDQSAVQRRGEKRSDRNCLAAANQSKANKETRSFMGT
jgi:hypothetical protein